MKKLLLLVLVICLPLWVKAQDNHGQAVSRDNLVIRPNSRDYNMVSKGNNHQRVVQMRSQALIRYKQATINRKMAMEKRRTLMQQQLLRKQNVHQRLVQRRRHR
jgi:hypothetical protein